jgi:hypothetical protein
MDRWYSRFTELNAYTLPTRSSSLLHSGIAASRLTQLHHRCATCLAASIGSMVQ